MPIPSPPRLNHPADRLVDQLRREEELLLSARECLTELNAALRRGDVSTIQSLLWSQEALVSGLQGRAEERARAAVAVAEYVGMPTGTCTLKSLAAKLTDPWAGELNALRSRFHVLTREIAELRDRNANLIESLRVFFRGLSSGLISGSNTPVRYGPSGARLGSALSAGFSASG